MASVVIMEDEEMTHPGRPTSATSTAVASPKEVRFKKTHKRNESKLSRISHLSIRSLGRGGTIDDDDETDGANDAEQKPIYLFETLISMCPWMPRLSLPGSVDYR
jgi:hypothetical protein